MIINYDEKKHRYYDDAGDYTSVTKLVSKFTPVFDTQKVSTDYAKRHGNTAEFWQEKWAAKALASRVMGTKIHAQLEYDITLGLFSDDSANEFSNYGLTLRSIFEKKYPNFKINTYYTEDIVHNEQYRVAGRYDLLLVGEVNGSPHNILVDFKTGKNTNNIFGYKNEMLLPPFDFVPNSKYCKSAMQLGLYCEMAEAKHNLKIGDCLIAGIFDNEYFGEVSANIVNVNFFANCSKLKNYFDEKKTKRN